MSEKKMIGYTTIFSIDTSTEPKGATNCSTFSIALSFMTAGTDNPRTTPRKKPMSIRHTSGTPHLHFIVLLLVGSNALLRWTTV